MMIVFGRKPQTADLKAAFKKAIESKSNPSLKPVTPPFRFPSTAGYDHRSEAPRP